MNWLRRARSRLGALLRKDKLDAALETEMRLHIELQTEENIAAGIRSTVKRSSKITSANRIVVFDVEGSSRTEVEHESELAEQLEEVARGYYQIFVRRNSGSVLRALRNAGSETQER